jgi:hypothetical protein
MRPTARHAWIEMHNRDERLTRDRARTGVRLDGKWTSDLHLAKVFPALGGRLMRRALRDWPILFQHEPIGLDREVEISFIIGHRGLDRLPQLLLTIQTIASQRDAVVECVVVEQADKPEVRDELAGWVRYVHTRPPTSNMPYCRAWAFNVGARHARGAVLVLHDNDMLIPQDYAAQTLLRINEGYEVANLKRFIFFLSQMHTTELLAGRTLVHRSPGSVMQNAQGGGSLGITRDGYFAIGGFDESFMGWGGEDNEFWERAQTLRVWNYGYLPLVHQWHQAQSEKVDASRYTASLYKYRSAISVKERIAELTAREIGKEQSPYGFASSSSQNGLASADSLPRRSKSSTPESRVPLRACDQLESDLPSSICAE